MSTDDGSFGHATNKTPRPNIQLDKATLSKLNQLSYQNEELANCMCRRLQDHAWGWDAAKKLCESELEGRKVLRIKIDAIQKDAKRMKERAAQEQIKRAIKTDKEEKKQKIALDQKLEEITKPKRVKLPFTPRVTYHSYCVFCDTFHPTTIEVDRREFKHFTLDSYHVSPYMTVDSEGHDRKPTDRERCVNAIMENRGCDQDEAERKCDQLLNDPLTLNRYIKNPKLEKVTKQTKEDTYVAEMVARQGTHPSIPQRIFKQDIERRNQYINWLVSSGRLTRRKGKMTTSMKPLSQLETCIKQYMLEENMTYEEAKAWCKEGAKNIGGQP